MTVLALDLGTTTGWACGADERDLRCGFWRLKVGRYDTVSMRYVRFERHLDELHKLVGFRHVVYEEVRKHRGTDAAHIYGGLQATLLRWCETRGVPCEGVPVGTIKKHWAGKGNASKDHMRAAADERGYAHSGDENEIDALALAHWYVTEHQASSSEIEELLK
ncbi:MULTISPECIES: hypothetical protein [unclassified Chelatococcus]|uniref:hypothetical protein n=1 Tax=unclassified Chelatococcus TaxID=2638111 RepID=UPI0002F06BCE|nr:MULTISPECIES: hypothetical protein [unclassified Chelatococcus]ALA16103.1 hypothetical protein AL346_00210 [Chelatococcus sp. CO-6]